MADKCAAKRVQSPNDKRELNNNAKDDNDFICNPRISQEVTFIQFVYDCQRYFKQNMYDNVKIQRKLAVAFHIL